MKRMLIGCIAAVGFLWCALPASAANVGTFATAKTAECTENPCVDNFQLLLDLFASPVDTHGGGGELSASATLTTSGQGEASTNMSLSGGLNTPVATASALSLFNNTIAIATSVGVQGFQYTGLGETLNLSVMLTGDIFDPLDTQLTGLTALVMLFLADDASLSLPDDLADPLSLALLLADIEALRSNPNVSVLELEAQDTGVVNMLDVVNLDVMTGDDLFLVAQFGASAVGNSASAISNSTLSMGFSTTELVPSAVPIPSAVWLLSSAILLLTGASRSKRRLT